MLTVAIVDQKGGVGKTTTTVNVGHALMRAGLRVAFCDLDPQGHLAACLGVHAAGGHGVDEVLLEGVPMAPQPLAGREGCRFSLPALCWESSNMPSVERSEGKS